MTYKDIREKIERGEVRLHHTASCPGYVSRKICLDECPVDQYSGRFGKGYIVHFPDFLHTRSHPVTYYIEE